MAAIAIDDDVAIAAYGLDSPVNPISPSSDDSSDNNMQIDSDLDVRQTPDIDADGEIDEGTDSDLDPPHAHLSSAPAPSSSYSSKRAVRAPPVCASIRFRSHIAFQIKDEEDSVGLRVYSLFPYQVYVTGL